MFEFLKETYYVAWGDLRFVRHNIKSILITSLAGPILYLFAFGFGLGKGIEIDGIPYVSFIIPGIAALTSLSASFSPTFTRFNVQRMYFHSLDEMMLCPLNLSAIALGKSIQGAARGLLSTSIIFAIGLALSSEYLHLTPLYIACIVLSCFTFSFLGLTASLLVKTHQHVATFNVVVILPMTFLCGTFFSVSSLHSPVFQAVLYALPLTHSSAIIRASSLDWGFPWVSMIILLCFAAALFSISIFLLKRKIL